MMTRPITIDNGTGRFRGDLTDLRVGQLQLIANLTEAPRGWPSDYVWMPTVDIYENRDPSFDQYGRQP